MRRAARVDDNQHELVEALKKIGAKCYFIGRPVDLLVGFRGKNLLLEVKRQDKRGQASAVTKEQQDFIATWPGDVEIVHSIDEAISAVVGKGHKRGKLVQVLHASATLASSAGFRTFACPRCGNQTSYKVKPLAPSQNGGTSGEEA